MPEDLNQTTRPAGRSRWLRRPLFLVACLVTLVAVFYTEENWRGKRAWEHVEKDLRMKGARLDWTNFIPAPIADDQNIFKAPYMQSWFVKGGAGELSRKLGAATWQGGKSGVRLAELRVVPPGSGHQQAIRLDDPAAPSQLAQVIRTVLGPTLNGARAILICAQPLDQIRPARIDLEAESLPDLKELKRLLPPWTDPHVFGSSITFQTADTNSFSLVLSFQTSWCAAADYLSGTAEFEPEFELLRQALKRPYARMEGDYSKPYALPTPNFVAMRTVAQTLSERAQAFLLLKQPEAAARELMLVRDMCRLLEAPPEGNPMTLVSAMINVAISGLYTYVVQDGLRLGVWTEPQLKALQEQCAQIDLLPFVYSSFEGERAAFCHLLGTMNPSELGNFFASLGNPKASLWERIKDPENLLIAFVPTGWVHQNRATVAVLEEKFLECFDLPNRVVFPARSRRLQEELLSTLGHRFSPNTFLAAVGVPNAVKATETTARNQTLANQAQLACALERYRLGHGQYPSALPALTPEFVSTLPHDIIGGQPLGYRRTDTGGFVLYSLGWNEREDGGVQAEKSSEGDWVWTQQP